MASSIETDAAVGPLGAFACYYLSTAVVAVGCWFGAEFIPHHSTVFHKPEDTALPFLNWDGVWYEQVASEGYTYDPQTHSSIAFFPGYPLAARYVKAAIGVSTRAALLIVSHVSLIGAFALMAWYLRLRVPSSSPRAANHALLALGFWPAGLFLRMAYSESLFLLLLLLVLVGTAKPWPDWLLILLTGAATGTRAVGVALLLPLAVHWWRHSRSWGVLALRLCGYGPLACWGLIAFLAYQWYAFGNALAFAETQRQWAMIPDQPAGEHLFNLLSLRPIWATYVPSASEYWVKHEYVANALFSFQFWNPIYFVACAACIIWGASRRWLNASEILLCAALLGIPYISQSERMMMLGFARFTCVIVPMYVVLGNAFVRLGPIAATVCHSIMAVQLFCWSALLAAGHRVF